MLSPTLTAQILAFLGVSADQPDLRTLDALVTAYTRHVAWESASRIARKATLIEPEKCPRWPEEFWIGAMTLGTGGTCYESNYAFFALLQALGYEGDLTLNDMDEQIACHSAALIRLDGQTWLVDVGLPLHAPIPVQDKVITARDSAYHTYQITPESEPAFRVERDRHPTPYCYTLIGRPVTEADYRRAVIRDYGDDGLFLDRVIVLRVVNGDVWRFNSAARPYQLEQFRAETKIYHFLGLRAEEASPRLAATFGLHAEILGAAFRVIDADRAL